METHGLICDSREMQRVPIDAGTYQKRLNEVAVKKLYTYLNYLIITSIPFISYLASFVNWGRMIEIPFHQRYLENIVFSISYFMLDPGFKGVAQIIFGEYAFWYIASSNIIKKWKLLALMSVFILFGTGYRWYGFIVASIHLAYSCSVSSVEAVSCTWCLGVQLAMLIGTSVLQILPVGIEDTCLVFIVYHGVMYAEHKHMEDSLAKVILAIAFLWMCCKYVRLYSRVTFSGAVDICWHFFVSA